MAAGILIGKFLPDVPGFLQRFEYAHTSIPIAVLIWVMIYPMMLKVDFQSIKNVRRHPQGLLVSSGTSWLIKPFLMFGLASFFFYVVFKAFIPAELARDYVAGAVLLGAAPCTAMVFVWSHLTKGDPAHTLVQVSINDLLIIFLFAPIVSFLLGVSNIQVPWDVLLFSVVVFVVIPLAGGALTRVWMIRHKGEDYFNNRFIPKFNGVTTAGLLLTLVIIFSFQGDAILSNPLHVLMIAVPLVLQNIITALFAYWLCKKLKQPHNIAAPAALIGASDFFELSVAVAITLFGATSPVVLVTTVGVLTEVPVMLLLVRFVNKTRHWFPKVKPENNIVAMELSVMKKMKIFEPAMCCPTGLCGVGVDPELLRISTVLNMLKGKGVIVDRYNLNSSPREFITNKIVNAYINSHDVKGLPVVTIDDEIVIAGRYPTNEEFAKLLDLPTGVLAEQHKPEAKKMQKKSGGCDCKGGCC